MLPGKKQSITTRLAFYAKLADKLDAIGQQAVAILCNFEQQAVTVGQCSVEHLMSRSPVYSSLQFLVTGSAQVAKQTNAERSGESNNNAEKSAQANTLNVYEMYLLEAQFDWPQWKRNSTRLVRQFLFLFASLVVSLLVSAICLSPAFRSQLHLSANYLASSFTRTAGGLIGKQAASDENYCSLPVLNGLQSAFLPPFDCNFCADLTEVTKVSDLDYQQFQRSYLDRLVPIVVQDATTEWSALTEFTVDLLKGIYTETEGSLDYHDQNCQFFPYKTSYESLEKAFNNISSTAKHDWYIGWSNCDSRIANMLRRYYSRPYFLPPDSLLTKTDWLFMGSPGYGAHLHIDNVGKPSWQAQVKGSKLWTIKPPFECLNRCATLEVQVDPGEIIVLDTNRWYHKTLIVGDEISITIGSEFD